MKAEEHKLTMDMTQKANGDQSRNDEGRNQALDGKWMKQE